MGYINADGTRDKAELVEMCKKSEAGVYFILDTKYQRKDNHFEALETDMREIAGRRGKVYCRAMPHSITRSGAIALPPMTPKRHSTTPHRPLGGSPAGAQRPLGGSSAAARRPLSALHQTDC